MNTPKLRLPAKVPVSDGTAAALVAVLCVAAVAAAYATWRFSRLIP